MSAPKSIYLKRWPTEFETKPQTFNGSLGELRTYLSRYPDDTPLGSPIEVVLKHVGVLNKPDDDGNESLYITEGLEELDNDEFLIDEDDAKVSAVEDEDIDIGEDD